MTTDKAPKSSRLADMLTLSRVILIGIIVFIILGQNWPDNLTTSLLATGLFFIAGVTDILDDLTGGPARAGYRKLGIIDDMGDTLLVLAVLAAMAWVMHGAGWLNWLYALPVALLASREIIVGLIKGRQYRSQGWPVTTLRSAKDFTLMFGTLTLLASPWLTAFLDQILARILTPMEIYNSGTPYLWWLGLLMLWISALLSILSGLQILFSRAET